MDRMDPWTAVELLGVTSSQYTEMSTEEYYSKVDATFDNLWGQMTPEDKQNYVNEIRKVKQWQL